MKTKLTLKLAAAWLLLSTLSPQPSTFAQGTAFTYQGRLSDGSNAANGSYDLTFTLFGVSSGGSAIAGPVTNSAVSVTNGLFTVTLDFGPDILDIFDGEDRWLEVGVRTNNLGAFAALTPRQPITAVPYAFHAGYADGAGQAYAAFGFSDPLAGDVTGTQTSTVVTNVGGQSAANVASAVSAVNAATSTNIPNTIVKRDASGNFSVGTITGTVPNSDTTATSASVPNAIVARDASGNFSADTITANLIGAASSAGLAGTAVNFSGGLLGDVVGRQNSTVVTNVGGVSSVSVALGASAANAATSANTASTIVKRDASGNFTANAITATSFIGSGASLTAGTVGLSQLAANSVDSSKILDGSISNADISDTAAIADTKLATIATAGKVAETALSGNVALLNRSSQTFTGTNLFSDRIGIGTASPALRLSVAGSGAFNNTAAAGILVSNTTANGHGWEWHALDDGRMQLADFNLAQTRLVIDTNGNVGIGVNSPTNRLHVGGGATFSSGSAGANQVVAWTPGSASWSFTSDRNAKEQITPVDGREVLNKVSRVPVAEWNYQGYEQRHIGPMAQDFHAQFPLSGSETTLNEADLHGVALAAIQGLNQKLTDELQQKQTEITELRQSVAELKALVTGSPASRTEVRDEASGQ